jgi:type IV fimbrial biogenesis protein FimT
LLVIAMAKHLRSGKGFTLLELMITLAVVSILMVLAAPSFRDLIRRSKVNSASNALLADLSYARSEAIARGAIVSLCPSSNGATCTSGTTVYDTGWLVYTYAPGSSEAGKAFDGSKPATNLLLRATRARDEVSMQATTANIISFGSQGQMVPSNALVFWTCFRRAGESSAGASTDKVPGVQLSINGSGSVSSQKLGDEATCIP